jgi:hypothetical protein
LVIYRKAAPKQNQRASRVKTLFDQAAQTAQRFNRIAAGNIEDHAILAAPIDIFSVCGNG